MTVMVGERYVYKGKSHKAHWVEVLEVTPLGAWVTEPGDSTYKWYAPMRFLKHHLKD